MKVSLEEWYSNNIPSDNMLWKDAMWKQLEFIRDILPAALIFVDYEERKLYSKNDVHVISTHTSKSVKLPVYQLDWHGISFIIRHNFHDWKLTVISDTELIGLDQYELFDPKEKIDSYCYENNKSKFTCIVHNRFNLYCLFKIISNKYCGNN